MAIILERKKNLKNLNTFGIEATAPFFCEVHSINDLQEIFRNEELKNKPLLILGGGSNVLFTKDPEGLVVLNKIQGIDVIKEDDKHIWVKVGGGVNWHEFVLYTIANNWGGIENLSLIPGTTGAAPMQNIGAYGVEIKDTFDCLQAVERSTGNIREFTNHECEFDYRSSIFKTSQKDKFVIASVTFRLNKFPSFNTSYGAIQDTLKEQNVQDLTIKAISDAVIHIRQSKLPDPKLIGNAGSFFKNPVIRREQFEQLQKEYPEVPFYPQEEGLIKIPAGWLIEKCGWKGKRRGNVGVHEKQALVLVNYGGARGEEIKQLSEDIQASVLKQFGIELHAEVNLV